MKFPLYAKSKSSGRIVKFISSREGFVIVDSTRRNFGPSLKVGGFYHNWTECTIDSVWEILPIIFKEDEDFKTTLKLCQI